MEQWDPRLIGLSQLGSCPIQTPFCTSAVTVQPTEQWVQMLLRVSTGTPALDGTYDCQGLPLEGMQAEANALMLGGTTPVFADGSTSLAWADKAGGIHTFTPAQFLELVHAVNYFVSQCAQYGGGATTTAPATTATIA